MRMEHRSRVEGGDLLVVEIGGDERLGGEGARHLAHMVLPQAQPFHAVALGAEVLAYRRHDQGGTAELLSPAAITMTDRRAQSSMASRSRAAMSSSASRGGFLAGQAKPTPSSAQRGTTWI